MQISATIVTYKNSHEMLNKAISSFLNTEMDVKLYIVDNSPTDEIKTLCNDSRIEYIFNNANVGFGAGHNVIMCQPHKMGEYHIVLNPDIYFDGGVIEELFNYMHDNCSVGLVMPDVYYPDGERQYLPKLLPYISDLIYRRFNISNKIRDKRNHLYEMRFADYNNPFQIAIASGCFSFFRKSVIVNENILYDDRFFMYFEDFDISRRVSVNHKIVCNPNVNVVHEYERGSHKNSKLFKVFVKSLMLYFTKWGWLFDKRRGEINKYLIEKYSL